MTTHSLTSSIHFPQPHPNFYGPFPFRCITSFIPPAMARSLHTSPPMADADNSKLLQELDALSQSLYQAHTARRTASLALPRSSDAITASDHSQPANSSSFDPRTRPRRLSMSPFRSRPQPKSISSDPPPAFFDTPSNMEKKGIRSWKPIRAISHIGKRRLSILFSIEVVTIQSLPASMNGIRLSVGVRKKESKEGAVKTMPARVLQAAADFEETLFIKSHVYCNGGGSSGKPLRFEPRVFVIYPIAIDAPELDFGRSSVDLSLLVKESMEKSFEGSRIRQWDTVFKLSGKAKGGELVIKLGFQIMEDGGVGIYSQANEVSTGLDSKGLGDSSSTFARRHSKSSFSISSPRAMRPAPLPSKDGNSALELKGIEDFNLDEDPSPKFQPEPEAKTEDLDLPEFDVIDKGIEVGFGGEEEVEVEVKVASGQALASSEVVKEVVHDNAHLLRLTELDSIANQIKALESMMINEGGQEPQPGAQELDAEEETATREFLHMLELEGDKEIANYSLKTEAKEGPEEEEKSFLSDLGRGLGSVVHTRDGGYLTSMNPFDLEILKRETPKLAMQISKPIIINDPKPSAGTEIFQKVSAKGFEELGSKLLSLTSMDELIGKTAEQIAFEGIASAIVTGRKIGRANSTAAKSVAGLKSMAKAMNEGRKERILSGIWNVREEPLVSIEEILSFSLQKMETMTVEGLKVEAGVAEEEAPFDVSPAIESNGSFILDSAVTLEDWLKKDNGEAKGVILMVLVQLRDPVRRYEAVGAPMIGMVQAARVGEEGFKVGSLHVGGMKLRLGRKRTVWDGERQRLTAMQWLVAYGMVKGVKKSRLGEEKEGRNTIWSFSARLMADMWLKATRNPDVRLPHP